MTRPDWADLAVSEARRTTHEYVRDTIRGAIVRGEFGGGARLIQSELAANLKVSTTPVREALRDLATEGLITLDRGRGGIVRELNWSEMEDLRLIRNQLEPLAIRLACERITKEQLDAADQLRQEMNREEDLGRWTDLNRRFHMVFHEATAVPRLIKVLKGLEEAAAVYVAQAQRWHPEIRRRANSEHQVVLDAYRTGDVDLLVDLMASHAAMSLEMTGGEKHRAR